MRDLYVMQVVGQVISIMLWNACRLVYIIVLKDIGVIAATAAVVVVVVAAAVVVVVFVDAAVAA